MITFWGLRGDMYDMMIYGVKTVTIQYFYEEENRSAGSRNTDVLNFPVNAHFYFISIHSTTHLNLLGPAFFTCFIPLPFCTALIVRTLQSLPDKSSLLPPSLCGSPRLHRL